MARSSPKIEVVAGKAHAGMRLDVFLTALIEDASRSFLKKLIKERCASLNGRVCTRPSRRVAEGDHVEVEYQAPSIPDLVPENIPLEILFEDSDMVVVNKPSGLVVHPAPGHYTGTLVHAVMYHCPDFQHPSCGAPEDAAVRPGIVHRLDRFTSGVMLVAKTRRALDHLARQARDHDFERRYLALVKGEFKIATGRINASIGRSLTDRSRMSVTAVRGRDAITHFKVVERFGVASLVGLRLETGRTHQIRVHLRFAGRAVLGDAVYGVTDFSKWQVDVALLEALEALEGQALHAELLGFEHPVTGERMLFRAPPPTDFQRVLDLFRAGCAG